MTPKPALIWFRRDLRTEDNPALAAAITSGRPVVALYVHDETGMFAPGGAQRWFLHHTLLALEKRLKPIGIPLVLRRGSESAIVQNVASEISAGAVYWNRRYASDQIETDKAIKQALAKKNIDVSSFNGLLLREPWEIKTKTGGSYKVYTPFWNALRAEGPSRSASPSPKKPSAKSPSVKSENLDHWEFVPTRPNWAEEFASHWPAGEDAALAALEKFLDEPASSYRERRDIPAERGTSRLSPHLALGSISPLQIWTATHAAIESGSIPSEQGLKFLSEVAWRDFAYHLLFHNPQMPTEPLRPEFGAFPWRNDKESFLAWTRGETGIPIVDAGMRELWRTGWMHNRVRMIVASFLVKNLLLPWQWGERWFWDTLIDADPANNTASWQWVAGCGADAAPYFRIFNPVTQAEKFDPDQSYIREFAPHYAERSPLREYSGPLEPMVDLSASRKRALDAYQEMKTAAL